MSAPQILQNIISNFSVPQFIPFFREKSRSFRALNEQISAYNDVQFTDTLKLGEITFDEVTNLVIYAIKTTNSLTERSGKKAQYEKGKRILKDENADAGIFIFYDEKGDFRFSLIYAIHEGTRKSYNYFKRFTYFVSKDQTNKTFLKQIGEGDFSSIGKIKEAFSVEPVTKQFYSEIQNWYFWAMDRVKFPEDYKYSENPQKDREIRNATSLIRLITRIIFIWFLKEKGLVPQELFDTHKLKNILNLTQAQGVYYNAILQNLFFATLNQKMSERKFAKEGTFPENRSDYGVKTLYRYREMFKIPEEEVLTLFKDIPFLNGGLFDCLDREDETGKVIYIDGFSRNPEKRAIVPDYLFFQQEEQKIDLTAYGLGTNKSVRGLIEILKSYNFTVDENTPVDQEIALDPELLGKVFENLLASYNPETSTTARKATGSYYTPREIVDYMVEESLTEYLSTVIQTLKRSEGEESPAIDREKIKQLLSYSDEKPKLTEQETKKLIKAIDEIKILDPACGSGAFPMGILHKLVNVLQKIDPTNRHWYELQYEKALKASEEVFKKTDKKEREELLNEINNTFDENVNHPDYARKLYLIENCIYGVDIQPIAIQISKLRFFISLIIDQKVDKTKENLGIRPLPNLETKFVSANTLIGLEKPAQMALIPEEIKELEQKIQEIRHRYFQAKTRTEKLRLQKKDRELREKLAEKLETCGFPHNTAEKIAKFDLFDQNASCDWFDPEWMFGVTDGFDIVIGNPPHGADLSEYLNNILPYYDYYDSRKNSASLFMSLSVKLLKYNSICAYIIPKSLTFVDGWKRTRELILNHNQLLSTIDICKSFENVKLEHVVVIYKKAKDKRNYKFSVGEYWNESVNVHGEIEKSIADEIDIIPCYMDEKKMKIYKKMMVDSVQLQKISETFRGLPWQSKVSEEGEIEILRGRNIAKYCVRGPFDKVKLTPNDKSNKKLVTLKQQKIISQNIVAHVMNPYDHLIIIATLDRNGLLTLDTCMNTILTESNFIYEYVLAILNSKLASWFYYWFVYNRAIRTMHFDGYYMGKLPIKKVSLEKQKEIASLVDKLLEIYFQTTYANTSELEIKIDNLVYNLYNLSEDEIKIIENK